MFKAFITCFLVFFPLTFFAQNFTLTGTVLDENKLPVVYSNVIISNADISTAIEGTTTDETGAFKFENVKSGSYTLKISFIGFEDQTITIDLVKNTNLGVIILKEKLETLNDVTITAKRPTVKRLVDRLVFNVENSTLSNTNVLDVLKHTPGVMVHDDKITVKQSTPTVYINDRKVHLSATEIQQLLEGTPANNIKSIEVITNPPAKYEAEGGSVLNIVTSKNIVAGYNGSVFGNYKQGSEYPKYTLGTSHFFKTEKISSYLNYNISPKKDFRHNDEFVNFIENDQTVSSWETDFNRTRKTSNQTINANIEYELNANNSLVFSTNMLISPRENTKTVVNSSTEVFSPSKTLDSIFDTNNRLVDEAYNFAFTIDYIHKFKKEGEKLSVSAHHTNYDFSSFQDVKTGYFFQNGTLAFRNNNFQTFSNQIIQLYTGQLDYELPLSETSQFEAGIKISKINSDSKLRQYTIENDVKTADIQNSDTFVYDEFNYAVYGSYSKDWDKWSLKFGLRNEFTDITGNSLSTNAINKNYYVKLFPSFYVLNKLNENNELYFDYNKRIYRPRYSELNPFKYFLNDKTYHTGNPNLQPQIDDNFTLGYTFNTDFTFEVYYRNESNPTLQITFQDNEENLIKYIDTNIDKSISYGIDFTTYTKIADRWNIYAQSSLFNYSYKFIAVESNNTLTETKKWSLYGYIINYFSFLKDKSLLANISYLYTSSTFSGPSNVSDYQSLDINLRKSLFNNKASLSIGVTDLFNSSNIDTKTMYFNQDFIVKSVLETRLFTFGFTYKFGNQNLKNNSKQIDLEERERLSNKIN